MMLLAAATVAVMAPVTRAAEPAADADRETVLREKANMLMASSSWKDALPIWAELYGLAGKPLDLWNAAVCQYHLAVSGQATPEQALALLQQYRDSPNVPPEKKAKAQRYADEMIALEQRQGAAAPAPQPVPPPAPRPAETVTVVPVASPPAAAHQEQGPRFRVAAWTAAGVGAAALIAGVYFSVRTHSLDNQVTNEPTFVAADDSAGRDAHTLQFVMYGVGAAALATAGILYYVGSPHGESPSVAFAPAAGPGHAGGVLSVRF
jgi:hypothetical protein